jgi:hypothetical protein
MTTANGTNDTIGVAVTDEYSSIANKTNPRPEIDKNTATLGVFCVFECGWAGWCILFIITTKHNRKTFIDQWEEDSNNTFQ